MGHYQGVSTYIVQFQIRDLHLWDITNSFKNGSVNIPRNTSLTIYGMWTAMHQPYLDTHE